MVDENTKLKDWYVKEFPEDDLGEQIPEQFTFYDLFECLDTYCDPYSLMGDSADSIIRERLFAELAEVMDVDYDYIYDQWLKTTSKPYSKIEESALNESDDSLKAKILSTEDTGGRNIVIVGEVGKYNFVGGNPEEIDFIDKSLGCTSFDKYNDEELWHSAELVEDPKYFHAIGDALVDYANSLPDSPYKSHYLVLADEFKDFNGVPLTEAEFNAFDDYNELLKLMNIKKAVIDYGDEAGGPLSDKSYWAIIDILDKEMAKFDAALVEKAEHEFGFDK